MKYLSFSPYLTPPESEKPQWIFIFSLQYFYLPEFNKNSLLCNTVVLTLPFTEKKKKKEFFLSKTLSTNTIYNNLKDFNSDPTAINSLWIKIRVYSWKIKTINSRKYFLHTTKKKRSRNAGPERQLKTLLEHWVMAPPGLDKFSVHN